MTPDSLRDAADEQIDRMLAAWPSSRPPDGWRNEMRRGLTAAADEPADIRRAVTKAIQSSVGRFVPDIATMTQAVARQRIARIAAEREAKQEEKRRDARQPAEPWRGWLALAATHAMLADRGEPRTPSPTLKPFVDLVVDLGYRNHHGCGEYRDVDGHLHPADPEYDKTLTASALHGAEQIWREQGMPAAPNPAALVGKPLGAAA